MLIFIEVIFFNSLSQFVCLQMVKLQQSVSSGTERWRWCSCEAKASKAQQGL